MQPSFCAEPDAEARQALLGLARQALVAGQHSERPLQVDRDAYARELRVDAAVFVTLTRDGALVHPSLAPPAEEADAENKDDSNE